MRDNPISPGQPCQNGYVARVISPIRREYPDHTNIFVEAHMREPIQLEFDFMRDEQQPLTLEKFAVGCARARTLLERSPVVVGLGALIKTSRRFDDAYRAERDRLKAAA